MSTQSDSDDSRATSADAADELNPGSEDVWFGKYKGQRFDSLDEGYKQWCLSPENADLRWYPWFVEINTEYERWKGDSGKSRPGSILIWFGRLEGETLDTIDSDEGYKQWCLHPDRAEKHAWHTRFVELYRQYEQWKADREDRKRSPGSIIVWFGRRFKGHTFAEMYKRPGYMRALREDKYRGCSWYYRVQELCVEYEEYLKTHRRKYVPRTASGVTRDIGDAVGPWDDKADAVDPNEQYEKDGFVVSDDEEEEETKSDVDSEEDDDDDDLGEDEFEEENYDEEFINDLDGLENARETGFASKGEVRITEVEDAHLQAGSVSASDDDEDRPIVKRPRLSRSARVAANSSLRSKPPNVNQSDYPPLGRERRTRQVLSSTAASSETQSSDSDEPSHLPPKVSSRRHRRISSTPESAGERPSKSRRLGLMTAPPSDPTEPDLDVSPAFK